MLSQKIFLIYQIYLIALMNKNKLVVLHMVLGNPFERLFLNKFIQVFYNSQINNTDFLNHYQKNNHYQYFLTLIHQFEPQYL